MSKYIEFKISDLARFRLLQNAFLKIKADKDIDSFEYETVYLEYFD